MKGTAQPALPVTFRDRFDRPIFIASTPRSGSSLLFETLSQAPHLFTVGGESHALIEQIPEFSPATRQWSSNRLTANDAAPKSVELLARAFYERLRDRDGDPPGRRVRVLEKTPKNALRVPFFDAAWSDATFVYLYRDPRQTLSSMIEAWVSGRFRTYPRLPGWEGPPWSLLLVPGWRRLNGRPVGQIVAKQWATTTEILIGDLEKIPRDRLRIVDYDEFVAAPQSTVEALVCSLDLGWDRPLVPDLPLSRHTISPPARDKWRAIVPVIEEIWPTVADADARARAFIDKQRA